MRKAIVIGATGLVGRALVEQLLADDRFTTVLAFVRHATGIQHPKLEEQVVYFNAIDDWKSAIRGDVLFSTLGTTLKQAGSQEAQYRVDFTYQHDVAKAAAEAGVPQYVLVSSAGASPKSRIFYSRMKGELEAAVQTFSFAHTHILQPGILQGNRTESRPGERIGIAVLSLVKNIPGLKKYRPIPVETVAKAMINASLRTQQKWEVITLEELFHLAEGRY